MKIHIEDKNHARTIVLPNSLILSRVFTHIASKAAKNKSYYLPAEKYAALFTALRRFARKNPNWVLVDVEESDGNKVKITL